MKLSVLISLAFLFFACGSAKKTSTQSMAIFDKQGHRGCRALMPENTIPAMLKAIDLGVTTLEMDVVISKDKMVVVSHDPFFNENITTTPEGNYLSKEEAEKRLLYTMDYDSIRKYDVGLKPHPGFPEQKKIAVNKPLLKDLLDATESYAKQKGRTIGYNIEIKSTSFTDGLRHPAIEEFVDLVLAVIQAKAVLPRVTIQSFDPRALQVLHRKYPGVTSALLIEDDDRRTTDEQLQNLGFTPDVYSPHYLLVNADLLQKCHQQKIKVIPWTVNRLEDMQRLKQMGVDGVITDDPRLFDQL